MIALTLCMLLFGSTLYAIPPSVTVPQTFEQPKGEEGEDTSAHEAVGEEEEIPSQETSDAEDDEVPDDDDDIYEEGEVQ